MNEGYGEGCWNSQGNKISKANCEATATFTLKTTAGTPEPVAEPKTVTYATLPPGVKSPAPNFESEFCSEYELKAKLCGSTWWDTEIGLTIGELYANWDYEWDSGSIKIVSGDGKDLLVWLLTNDCSECSESMTFHIGDFSMYDGKDRKFEPVTSSTLSWDGSTVEDPNFSWREDCSPLPVTVQPGVIDKMKICFEIPKNSDHFKLLEFYNLATDEVIALHDRSTISNTASKGSQSGGGCLIATAAFGSEMSPQVQMLREIRDNTVLQTESGTSFMTSFNQFYYSFSPTVADYERENPTFKEAVKLTLTPLLTSLALLQYADIDSESEMLGYGIGIILLNIGMYFIAPAVLITKIRSFYKLQ